MRRVGVLAAQGGFEAHARALSAVGVTPLELRAPRDLDALDGVILPGGESGAQLVALRRDALLEPLRALLLSGIPTLGTCAGLILLASRVRVRPGEPVTQESLALLDVEVTRNAWGRQISSFHAPLTSPSPSPSPSPLTSPSGAQGGRGGGRSGVRPSLFGRRASRPSAPLRWWRRRAGSPWRCARGIAGASPATLSSWGTLGSMR